MYVEPVKKQYIFSENFPRFIPVKEVAPHKYELVLPGGHNNFYTYKSILIFLRPSDSVAQLVEQLTLNQRVQSSSLCGVTQ